MPGPIIFVLGAVVGGAVTVAAYRLVNPIYALGKTLMQKTEGDFYAARNHVERYAKAVVNAFGGSNS